MSAPQSATSLPMFATSRVLVGLFCLVVFLLAFWVQSGPRSTARVAPASPASSTDRKEPIAAEEVKPVTPDPKEPRRSAIERESTSAVVSRGSVRFGRKGLPDADIYFLPLGLRDPQQALAATRTTAQGRFEALLPPGVEKGTPGSILIRAPGLPDYYRETVRLGAPGMMTLVWTIDVLGSVLDLTSGGPIAMARVVAHGKEAWTDGSGTFRIPDVKVSRDLRLETSAPGYLVRHEELALTSLEPLRHTIHLQRGHPLRLLFVDATTGAPLPGVSCEQGQADAEGELELLLDPGSSMTLSPVLEGYAALRWTFRVDELPDKEQLRFPLPALARVEGRVRDASGAPLSGASVVFHPDDPDQRIVNVTARSLLGLPGSVIYSRVPRGQGVTSDPDGGYSFPIAASPQAFRLKARHRTHCESETSKMILDVHGVRAQADLTLSLGGNLEVLVLDG